MGKENWDPEKGKQRQGIRREKTLAQLNEERIKRKTKGSTK